jgi:glycosyltransferase involved in cell wall biosynthesis
MSQQEPASKALLTNKVILLISNDYWGGNSFLSKHHYARVLASQGNEVFFLNHGNYKPGRGMQVTHDPEFENIRVINYRFPFKGLRFYPTFLAKIIYKRLAKSVSKAIGKPIDIVWCFDPFRFYDLRLFGADIHIFHPVDPFHSVNEMALAESADIIFGTAQVILDRYQNLDKPRYLIHHGLASSFLTAPEKLAELPGSNQVKAIYIGSILRPHVAWKQLAAVVEQNPEVDFVFVGPNWDNVKMRVSEASVAQAKALNEKTHVHFIGPKPFAEIKGYAAAADILLVCYDRENHADAPPNPHKMMEYFASGKLIVSNYFETFDEQADLLLMAKNNAAYGKTFQHALEHLEELNSETLQAKRKAFASQNTYPLQVEKIERLLIKHGF